jgi:hypothetical protein
MSRRLAATTFSRCGDDIACCDRKIDREHSALRIVIGNRNADLWVLSTLRAYASFGSLSDPWFSTRTKRGPTLECSTLPRLPRYYKMLAAYKIFSLQTSNHPETVTSSTYNAPSGLPSERTPALRWNLPIRPAMALATFYNFQQSNSIKFSTMHSSRQMESPTKQQSTAETLYTSSTR